MSTVDETGKIYISAINPTDHQITVPYNTIIASFEILKPTQAEKLIQIDPQLLALAKMRDHENIEAELNQMIQDKNFNQSNERTKPEYEKLWFPTPETCPNPEMSPLERETFDQIQNFQMLEKIDPKASSEYRAQFLQRLSW